MLPARLRRLPSVTLVGPLADRDVRRADTSIARLLGLAGLRALPPHAGLLLPRTRSIHTLGMRFALDLIWLDQAGRTVRVDRDVPPRRLRACREADAVIELPAGQAPHQGTISYCTRRLATQPKEQCSGGTSRDRGLWRDRMRFGRDRGTAR